MLDNIRLSFIFFKLKITIKNHKKWFEKYSFKLQNVQI